MDSDQARHFNGPDLGPNCLQRLLADDTSRQKVKKTLKTMSQLRLTNSSPEGVSTSH